MRLQLYVPIRYSTRWDPAPGFVPWEAFLKRVAAASGNLTLLTGVARWHGRDGFGAEPTFIVEVMIETRCTLGMCHAYADTWALFREYARQLLQQGEESVLIVQDNEPTFVRAT